MNNAKVIDLQAIPQDTSQEILEIYNRYRLGVIKNRPDITLLESLNRMFSELLLI